MDKVVVIGSVTSTKALLEKLIEYGFDIKAVFGYQPEDITNISGYVSFAGICKEYGIMYVPFVNINDSENIDILKSIRPDIIFAVGFSQLLMPEILSLPSKGIVGFHPTLLPKGRGRGPIAWLVLREEFACKFIYFIF